MKPHLIRFDTCRIDSIEGSELSSHNGVTLGRASHRRCILTIGVYATPA
jgi:hypothetical protein